MRSLPIRIETLAVLIMPTRLLAVTKVENLGGGDGGGVTRC